MNFIFSCWNYLSRVSEANEWEILSAREDKIRILKRPCNILYLKHKHVKEFSGRDRLLSSWIINEFLKRVRKPIAFKETLRPVNAV